MYATGQGINTDTKKAIFWLRAAAELSLDEAQYELGILYEAGGDLQQDWGQAKRWYEKRNNFV